MLCLALLLSSFFSFICNIFRLTSFSSQSNGTGKSGHVARKSCSPKNCCHSNFDRLRLARLQARACHDLRSTSHRIIVPSSLAEAKDPPSGLKAMLRTLPVWPVSGGMAVIGRPVAGSHKKMVSSQPPEARVWPSGLKATLCTLSVWPLIGRPIDWPLSTSHNLILLSQLLEANV